MTYFFSRHWALLVLSIDIVDVCFNAFCLDSARGFFTWSAMEADLAAFLSREWRFHRKGDLPFQNVKIDVIEVWISSFILSYVLRRNNNRMVLTVAYMSSSFIDFWSNCAMLGRCFIQTRCKR